MKKASTIIIIIFALINTSCKNKIQQADISAAQIVSEKLQGEKVEIFSLHQNNPRNNYIQVIIYNPKVLQYKSIDSNTAASFCAIQLYRSLSSKTIKGNDGLSISFNKETNHEFYFTMKDLNLVNQSANVINNFIYDILKNKWDNIPNYIDTSLCNIDSIYSQMTKLASYINDPIISYSFTDKQYEVKNITSDCLLFTIQLEDRYNKNQIYFYVATYKLDNNNKIIGIQNYK